MASRPFASFLLGILGTFVLVGCVSSSQPNLAIPGNPTKDGRSAAELFAKGREAAARGDAVRAEQYLTLAMKEGAAREAVLPHLLRACLRSSHLRSALNHAEPYLLEHPEDDALRYLVATIHLGLGQRSDARREIGLLLQRKENNPDAHYLLGIIESTGNVDAARVSFVSVIEHSSDEEQKTEARSRLAELTLRERDAANSLKRTEGGLQ